MNDRERDFELLRQFVRRGDQPAFAAITRRHLDLVYAVALRNTEDRTGAEELTQDVFAALARKAWQFGPEDSVTAWLYRTTLLKARAWVRGECRRRRREQAAAELGTTMKTPDDQPDLQAILPMLDDALLSLREKDRSALLLRFYESRSLRDVGAALGTSEDAAQKRVTGALDKLTLFLERHGFRTATRAVAAAALTHTTVAAPAATATAVINAALQSTAPAGGGLVAMLARVAGLSKAQVVTVCLVVAAIPAAWKWYQERAIQNQRAALHSKLEIASVEEARLSVEVERLLKQSARLEANVTASDEAQARNEENIARMAAFKARLQSLLTANSNVWLDDLPFVRVPKSALGSIDLGAPWLPKGPRHLQPATRELLALTPDETDKAESALSRYFSRINELTDSHLYETNQSSLDPLWSSARDWLSRAPVSKVFIVPPLGTEIKNSADHLIEELNSILDEERVKVLAGRTHTYQTYPLLEIMNPGAADHTQQLMLSIGQSKSGRLTGRYYWGEDEIMFTSDELPLSCFLPNAPPEDRCGTHWEALDMLPLPFNTRVQTWLTHEALTRLTK